MLKLEQMKKTKNRRGLIKNWYLKAQVEHLRQQRDFKVHISRLSSSQIVDFVFIFSISKAKSMIWRVLFLVQCFNNQVAHIIL